MTPFCAGVGSLPIKAKAAQIWELCGPCSWWARPAAQKPAATAITVNQRPSEYRMAIIKARSPISRQGDCDAARRTCGGKMRLSKGRGHS
jgi:hypothetical protein